MVNYKDLGLVNTKEMFAKAIKGGYRPKENKKPQKDFMACCQKTREQN